MSENAIEIKNLTKIYAGSKNSKPKKALNDVSLKIPKGNIFGLLGPNGAGKSTIINILAGLVVKTSGTVNIWGIDIDEDARQAKAAIGVVPQEINYDPFFSPKELLDIQAGMYGVPKVERKSLELLELVGLADKADAYTRTLSGGMRRRLMVAKAMVHSPPVLILDEPTAGVDVELRRQLWENVRMLAEKGVTVVLTTHYLEEAEELCDKIAIINHGEIIVDESTEALLSKIDQKEIIFKLDKEISNIPDELGEFMAEKKGKSSLKCRYSPADNNVGKMIELIGKNGFQIVDISTKESDLEDVFIQLTKAA
jgi:ABC-2 type transport system ATP-binding protein